MNYPSVSILQARAEALRKQVKEEIHSKTVIQARIQSDSSDLIKDRAETKAKKEKVKTIVILTFVAEL